MYIEPRLPDHTDIWTANLNSRIVHCFGEIEENMAESIVAQLLYLDAQNHEDFTLTVMVEMLLQVLPFTIPCSIYKATFVPFALVKP